MTREIPADLSELSVDGVVPELYFAELETDSGMVTAYDLWQRVDSSEYGTHMDTQPLRFAQRFEYDRDGMVRDLGADVVPRLHQYETGLYIAWILQAERANGTVYGLSDEEAGLLVFTGSIHDIGESTHPAIEAAVGSTVGDIAAGEKTAENRRVEKAVREFIYENVLPDVSPKVIDRAEAIISHQDDTVLHEIFEVAHNMQSHVTATRARMAFERQMSRVLDTEKTCSEPIDVVAMRALSRLHKEVVKNIGVRVEHDAREFIFPRTVLSIARIAIGEATIQTDGLYNGYRNATAV